MTGQLIQYIVVRADLLKTLNWPVGAVVAQACHACCAVTHLFYNDPHTQEYLKDLDNMHKVVLEASTDELNILTTDCLDFIFIVPQGITTLGKNKNEIL
jgi:peptidyl-tRNA hydrolase